MAKRKGRKNMDLHKSLDQLFDQLAINSLTYKREVGFWMATASGSDGDSWQATGANLEHALEGLANLLSLEVRHRLP